MTTNYEGEPMQSTLAVKGRMLPGVAGIAMFLLVSVLLNVFAAVNGVFGAGRTRYGVLLLCTLFAVGIFGLLRMRRWGWAMALAGCLVIGGGYGFVFARTHEVPAGIQAGFMLVFFLYLVRQEVRERMV